jgi:EmrB/QacA subfamily drug resistance transporter
METNRGASYKWWVLATVCLGGFMGGLDISVINVCLPRLAHVFKTDSAVAAWAAVGYLAASQSLMLTLARIGDAFGRKRIYVAGMALFTVGLLLCSLSRTIEGLIVSRIIQGAGSAMIIGLGGAILTRVFPGAERGKALGMLGAGLSLGLVMGPTCGGLIMDALDWRAVFYLQVPVGVAATVMASTVVKEQKDAAEPFHFDVWGATTFFAGMCCLLLFLSLGGRWGYMSPSGLVLAALAAALFSLFVIAERRSVQPVVDLSLFKRRLFTAATLSSGIECSATAVVALLMPFYLIEGLGYTASKMGLFLTVLAVMGVIFAPVSGRLSDRFGTTPLATAGIFLIGGALFLLRQLGGQPGDVGIALGLAMLGAGRGIFQTPNASSIMGSVPPERLGTASAIRSTSMQLGSSIGVALSGAIFASRLSFHTTRLTGQGVDASLIRKLSVAGGFRDAMAIGIVFALAGVVVTLARGRK